MTQAVEAVLNKGLALRTGITRMLGGSFPADTKCILLSSYFDIILEHHEAIALLISKYLCGSAFALVRPVFETSCRSFWVNACASDTQIEEISKRDTFRFPELQNMVDQIDAKYTSEGFFRGIKLKSWKAMCSYTHSGLLQVSRRFKEGDINPNYEEGEILEVLNGTNMLMLFVARLFFTVTGKTAEAKEAENMILHYEA